MSWGVTLWDQFEVVSGHTQKGIEFCERLGHFIKERCSIENEYASKLKKLVKSYQPKKKTEDDSFSTAQGFQTFLKELGDYAGQHEEIAENLSTQVLKDLSALILDTKAERKKLLLEANKQQSTLQTQMDKLDKSKAKYERLFREAEKFQEAYKKCEQDPHMARADIDKAKQQWQAKQTSSEDSKSEYALEVQRGKDVQREHFDNQMPQVFSGLQSLDEKRVLKVKEYISSQASIHKDVIPIVNVCIEGMSRAATLVDPQKDSSRVIEMHKTGYVPPNDIPFVDLSNGGGGGGGGAYPPSKTVGRADGAPGGGLNKSATYSAGKNKKRPGLGGIFGRQKKEEETEDFAHLPPSQQKKQLQLKLEAFRASLAKEVAERDGLLKMQEVYKGNKGLGDAASLDKGLDESAQKLDRLNATISKFEGYLSEAEARLQGGASESGSTPTPSPASVRRSGEVTSGGVPPAQNKSSNVAAPQHMGAGGQSASPHRPPAPFAVEQDSFDGEEDEFGEEQCTALYNFAATSEGSVSMAEGERLVVLERDQGDGWTHVRKLTGTAEGFVPTSYIRLID